MSRIFYCIIFMAVGSVFAEDSLSQKEKQMEDSFRSKNQRNFLKRASKVLAEKDDHLKTLNRLSIYHLRRNQLGLAKIVIERIISQYPKRPSSYNNKGVVALKEGRKDEAVLAFLKSLSVDRNYFPALVNLSSLYMKLYDYEKALPLLSRVYDQIEDSESKEKSKEYIKIANNYAVSLVWAKKWKQARTIYRRLVRKNQADVDIFINYAQFLIESLNNVSEAEKILNQADFRVRNNKDQRKVNKWRKKLKRRRKG